MKCEKCGCEIEKLSIDMFAYNGSDRCILMPFTECEESAVFIDTSANWCGYELSEKEQLETICCPNCGNFPFEQKEVQTYDIVRIVCFKSRKADEE